MIKKKKKVKVRKMQQNVLCQSYIIIQHYEIIISDAEMCKNYLKKL